jgi:general secretion pathway protein L
MLNLNSTIDLDFKQFFRWWKRELDFLLPKKIKQLILDEQGYLIVSPDGNRLMLSYLYDGVSEALTTVDINETGVEQFNILQEKDERLVKAKVIIRLPHQFAIQKELSLPTAAKENLSQVVAYELDRYTPFKPEQVYFAVKQLNGTNELEQIKVLLILTPRSILDGLINDIKVLGLSPILAYYDNSALGFNKFDDSYNLLPQQLRQKKGNLTRIINATLITLTGLLLFAVIATPVWIENQTVNSVRLKTNTFEKDAKKVKALQKDIDATIDETRQLLTEKSAAPAMIEMLNTLSALIPDDTWLSYLQYSDGHLQIQGESPTASTLIAVLEASDLFTHVRFASPVTQDAVNKIERFQITADVVVTRAPL